MQKVTSAGSSTCFVRACLPKIQRRQDASGNVMAVHLGSTPLEQPIYGSSRLGLYKGGRTEGVRTLGAKEYELSNHLGNVLTVVKDNIHLQGTDTWAHVEFAMDYYAFGSDMPGRTYSSPVGGGQEGAYRYGFNGKEKDTESQWGDTSYDYGFRIYNPRYARFLSVDPLTKSYPMLTPYQFASNRPIDGVDLDGLEYVKRIHIVAGNGVVVHTEDYVYYKMTEAEIVALGGTPAGKYNAAAHGPGGEGVQHLYINASGELLAERWNLSRNNLLDAAATHGIYSGGGSITMKGFSNDYDFSWQPIDLADAIAKEHDINYSKAATNNYQGFVEDVRTLDADRLMLRRIAQVESGQNWLEIGLEEPFRNDMAGETKAAFAGQKRVIGILAEYKAWKITQANQGQGISILIENDARRFIEAAGSWWARKGRTVKVEFLQTVERGRLKTQEQAQRSDLELQGIIEK